MQKRFDVVVLNYKRITSFFNNFGKITRFNPACDRITIVSSSPSEEEAGAIDSFVRKHLINIRYLTRENRGIDQLARVQYFTGAIGSVEENLEYSYIFQMQDHYLDTTSKFSRYGDDKFYTMKGDVVPQGFSFNLDEIEKKMVENAAVTAFCDRLNPCWFQLQDTNYIAPNGANFIVKTSKIKNAETQKKIRELGNCCDNTYDWAVFAEFIWGYLFFKAGDPSYDLKRNKLFIAHPKKSFHLHNGPDNPRFKQVFGMYSHKMPCLQTEWIPLMTNQVQKKVSIVQKVQRRLNLLLLRILSPLRKLKMHLQNSS